MANLDPALRKALLERGYSPQSLYQKDPTTSAMGLYRNKGTASFLPREFSNPARAVRTYLANRKNKRTIAKRNTQKDALDMAIEQAKKRNERGKLKFNPYTGYSYE